MAQDRWAKIADHYSVDTLAVPTVDMVGLSRVNSGFCYGMMSVCAVELCVSQQLTEQIADYVGGLSFTATDRRRLTADYIS